jgi:hypothetical protein
MSRYRRPIVALAVGVLLMTAASCADDPDRAGHRARPAEPGHCDGTIGSRQVDEVRVPSGATCTLDGTVVDGNVSIAHGGTLRTRGIDVDGDLEAEGATYVEVRAGSTIGGNLQLQAGGGVVVVDSTIRGDLRLEENRGRLAVTHNQVRGNLALDENRGGVSVAHNDVGGDLGCEENRPAPSVSGNDVSGNQEDQCRR